MTEPQASEGSDSQPENESGYELAKMACPQCNRQCDPQDVLCTDCGWNFRTKSKVPTGRVRNSDRAAPKDAAKLRKTARVKLRDDQPSMDSPSSIGKILPSIGVMAVLAGLCVMFFLIYTASSSQTWVEPEHTKLERAREVVKQNRDKIKSGAENYQTDFSHVQRLMTNFHVERNRRPTGIVSNSKDVITMLKWSLLPERLEVTWSGQLTKVERKKDYLVLGFSDFERPVYESLNETPFCKIHLTVLENQDAADRWDHLSIPSIVTFKGKLQWDELHYGGGQGDEYFISVNDATPVAH